MTLLVVLIDIINKQMKQQNKHQTIVPLEKDAGQIKDIYKMINQQEKYMEDILSKYNYQQPPSPHQSNSPESSFSIKNRTLEPTYT